MRQPESIIKSDIKKALAERGAYFAPVAQGSFGKPGDPDMVVCYRGLFIGIEVKTAAGSMRPIQKRRMKEIRAAGGVYALPRSVEDAMALLDELDPILDEMERMAEEHGLSIGGMGHVEEES